jgi:hypothetical protein
MDIDNPEINQATATTPSASDNSTRVATTAWVQSELSSWSGSTSITTLGTITTGTWNGSTLAVAYGGTNSSTALVNDRVMISSAGSIVESPTITTSELGLLNGIVSVSTGVGDNDKFVTQGYVDDAVASSDTFIELTDTPSSYTTANALYNVNGAATAVNETTTLLTEPAVNQFTLTRGTTALTMQADLTVTGTASITGTNTGDQTTSGTTDRITVTNGSTNPVIDIASTYVGQTSITTLGTIATGTWQGTTIAVNQGGTGQTSYTNGQLLIGNTTGNTLTKATLTEGEGIDITNGTGSITISGEDASTTNKGIVELATDAETNTGTDTARAMTPSNLNQWAGTTNITTLGTITTGTWNGSTIDVAYGGTGNTSFTSGSIPFSNGTILTQDNSNLFWDDTNNRLGIGTNSPPHQLDVNGNTSGTTNYVTLGVGDLTGVSPLVYLGAGNGLATITSRRNFPLNFAVNNSEVARFGTNGYLGIGETNPTRAIQVSGVGSGAVIEIDADAGGNESSWTYHSVGGTLKSAIGYRDTTDTLSLFHNSSDRLVINNSGYVGIGETDPNAPLQFNNPIQNRVVVMYEQVNNDHQYYGFGINNLVLRYQVPTTNANHVFYAGTSTTTSNELMRITGTGRVGIGNSSPATALEINANPLHDNTFSYDANAILVTHPTPTSNTTLNDPQDVLYLVREGTNAQAYAAAATFQLSRYENSSTNSRTRLDISLANAFFDQVNVFTLKSNGDLAITGNVTSGTWQGTTIAVDQGGTGQTSYTNGQLLIGNTTGNTLTKATLTEGTGITITNGTGSITIASNDSEIDHGSLAGLADDDHTQYHNDSRALTWLGTRSTTDLSEGTNLYFTDERVDDRVSSLLVAGEGIDLTYDDVGNTLTIDGEDASITNKGIVELATDAETNTGTDTTRAMTPSNLNQWAGTTNITTLGTIATGTWNGSTIGVAYGGTGNTSFTSGAIPFYNGSILTEDPTQLFWDDANNRLGIGTNSPTTSADIWGSAFGADALRLRAGNTSVSTTSNQILLSYNSGALYTHAIKTRHNGGSSTGNAIDFYNWNYGTDLSSDVGTAHAMTLQDGYVGIRNTDPQAELDITGSALLSSAMVIGSGTLPTDSNFAIDSSVGETTARFGDTEAVYLAKQVPAVGLNAYLDGVYKFGKGSVSKYGGYITFIPSTGDMILATSTAAGNADAAMSSKYLLYMKQSGYVGIGNISPQAELDVSGSAILSSTMVVGSGTLPTDSFFAVDGVTGNTTARFGDTEAVYMVKNSPTIGFNSYYNSGWKFGKGSVSKYGSFIGMNASTGDMILATSTAAGNADAGMSTKHLLYMKQSGNIGLGGLTTPNAPLQFNNSVQNRVVVMYESANNDHQYYGFGLARN